MRKETKETSVDTKANTSRGGGALEVGDLRLLEDGSERNGALVTDAVVVPETAREGGGAVKEQACVNGR